MKMKEPTATSQVLEALAAADDFLTTQQLMAATRQPFNRVSAALHHLRKHHAVDTMLACSSTLWYATTQSDNRLRTVDERTPEKRPRRRRGSFKKL